MRTIVYIVAIAGICSCSKQKAHNAADYMGEVNKIEDLKIERTVGNYTFKARLRPQDEMVLSENSGQPLNAEVYNKLSEKYKDLLYFNFSIATEKNAELINEKGKNNIYQMLDYLSNQMQNDFYLVTGKDTIACKLYYYERNFELLPENTISLGFDKSKLFKAGRMANDITLVYEDKILSTGIMNFKFDEDVINNLPILKYENN